MTPTYEFPTASDNSPRLPENPRWKLALQYVLRKSHRSRRSILEVIFVALISLLASGIVLTAMALNSRR